ncbi:MAG TPA: Rieske (2Fe-2S) protein, partial [Chloroflexia bacterium]|nr:Rieske (2Fe-2S) protein [Chloroflexia bacterium]
QADAVLDAFLPLLDKQQQVNEAGELVARYLVAGGADSALLATLARALVRENRDFHTIQTVEAACNLYGALRGTAEGRPVLIAAARYLAAHAPTSRGQAQTYGIALRLDRGEHIYAG